jgi:glyoxylase-like metal-dependent hydrolase (beta-lactamase superfamily II)
MQKLPWVRAMIIGQPPDLKQPYYFLGETIDTQSGQLRVISAPGHCDDHIVLYDSQEKLLLAGDSFMGSYFATPNPDVDSRKWIKSLERLMELEIEILVEGHGHIHTLRPEIPDFPGVVVGRIRKSLSRRSWTIYDGCASKSKRAFTSSFRCVSSKPAVFPGAAGRPGRVVPAMNAFEC